MGYRDPFVMPANDQQRAICNAAKANLAQGLPSDHIALLKAMEGFNTGEKKEREYDNMTTPHLTTS